jgi:protein-L-isoaspartate(D-aspartate) O-methyltransferase
MAQSFDFAAARLTMVESQVRPADVTDYEIQDAMRTVPRETLVPAEKSSLAYADAEIAYADGRWLLRPRDVAKLLQALQPRRGESALAIAAPYAAEVLKAMGLQVTGFDGADLLTVPEGEFDVVISEGAVVHAPMSWREALANGGRLGVVERRDPVGKARLYMNSDGLIATREVFDSAAPLLPEFAPRPTFAF